MAYKVLLLPEAERDILDIHGYVAVSDGPAKAGALLDRLEAACARLDAHPERGNIPKELADLGIREFREAHFKPYRIIYRILGAEVAIYCVLDGRRDMQALLQRRLLD